MPEYLDSFEIDWGWQGLKEPERQIVRLWEARFQAQPTDHTLLTFTEWLDKASGELSGRPIRARASDVNGDYMLRAFNGSCQQVRRGPFDPSGVFPEELTAELFEAAGVDKVRIGLVFPGAMLAVLGEEAARLDRSLSWVVQWAWKHGHGKPPAVDGLRKGEHTLQGIYVPLAIYAELAAAAKTADTSMSRQVHTALEAALPAIRQLPSVD